MSIGERLKEERERLGFNQTGFAELVGATRKTLFNWETGVGSPTADALAAWAEAGLDALYLLTGDRDSAMPALDIAERVLVDSYRRCNAEARQNLIQTAALLSAGLAPSTAAGGGETKQKASRGGMNNSGAGAVQIGHAAGSAHVFNAPIKGGVAGRDVNNKGKK